VVKQTIPYVDAVIVADDNSTDDTFTKAECAGALPINHRSIYHGVGINTWAGIWKAINLGATRIVTLDGDGQHNPNEIPLFLEKLNTYDIVIGTRNHDLTNMPLYRKFGNHFLTSLYNFGYPESLKIADSQCGFRAFRAEVFRDIRTVDNGFGFIIELPLKAMKLGLKIGEVPVACIYHDELKTNSTMNPIKHGIQVALKTIEWKVKLSLIKH
jgi:glycosyltransferase involved in cell wall biosynthesis